MDFALEIERILVVLHTRHGYSASELEKIQGALRIYEAPLIEALRQLMKEDLLFEHELVYHLPSLLLPWSPLAKRWQARIRWRGLLDTELALREATALRPIPLLLEEGERHAAQIQTGELRPGP